MYLDHTLRTLFGVNSDGDGVLHGAVDGQHHVSIVRDVQRHHADVGAPREDQEAAHACNVRGPMGTLHQHQPPQPVRIYNRSPWMKKPFAILFD